MLGVVACAFLSQCSVEGSEDPEAADSDAYTAIYANGDKDYAQRVLAEALGSLGASFDDGLTFVLATGTVRDLVVASLKNIWGLFNNPGMWEQIGPDGIALVADFNDWNISGIHNFLRLKTSGDPPKYICYHQFAIREDQSAKEEDKVRSKLISSLIYPSMIRPKRVFIKFEQKEQHFDHPESRILPEYVRVTFECSDDAVNDISQKYGPLYESVPCGTDAESATVKSGKTRGVTFRYKLDGDTYKLVQVFPTTWDLDETNKYYILGGLVDLSRPVNQQMSRSRSGEERGRGDRGGFRRGGKGGWS
jgi:hypothetical protein